MADFTNDQKSPQYALSSLGTWGKVLASFVFATGLQIFIYGGPHLYNGQWLWGSAPYFLYLLVELFFFFGPAIIAGIFSLFILRIFYHRQGKKLSWHVFAVVFGFALVSSYIGVLISFNTWGT